MSETSGTGSGHDLHADRRPSRPLTVLHASVADLAARSGAAEHVLGIAEGLQRIGHRVHLVAACSGEGRRPFHGLDRHLVTESAFGPASMARRVAGQVVAAAKEARPDIVYLRAFPMDHLLLARKLVRLGIPYVVEVNAVMGGEYAGRGKPLRGHVYDWIQGRSLAAASGWVVMSAELHRWARAVSRADKPALLGRNGYDPSRLRSEVKRDEARRRLGVDGSDRILLMAGFSRPWHGADRAIALLERLPSTARLWLVGDHEESVVAPLRRAATRLGVEQRVTFFPWQELEDLASLTVAADVGLAPLALERKGLVENQPLKIASYLALGLPVLANYVDPRFSGRETFYRYVRSSEPATLAAELVPLMDLSRESREQARTFARRELSWEVAAVETAAFLDRIVASSLSG